MGVVLVAPRPDIEKIVMGNDERTEYRVRNRVVEVHPVHVSALKMMGFFEPPDERPKEVYDPTVLSDTEKATVEAARAAARKAEEAKAAAKEAESKAAADAAAKEEKAAARSK